MVAISTYCCRDDNKEGHVKYFYTQSKTREGQPAAFGIFDGLLHSRRRHWGGLHCCIHHQDHKIKQVSWQTHFWDLVSLTHGFQLAIICATSVLYWRVGSMMHVIMWYYARGGIGHFWNIFRICERPLVIGTQYWTAMAPRIFMMMIMKRMVLGQDLTWTWKKDTRVVESSRNQNIVLFYQIVYIENPNHK